MRAKTSFYVTVPGEARARYIARGADVPADVVEVVGVDCPYLEGDPTTPIEKGNLLPVEPSTKTKPASTGLRKGGRAAAPTE